MPGGFSGNCLRTSDAKAVNKTGKVWPLGREIAPGCGPGSPDVQGLPQSALYLYPVLLLILYAVGAGNFPKPTVEYLNPALHSKADAAPGNEKGPATGVQLNYGKRKNVLCRVRPMGR